MSIPRKMLVGLAGETGDRQRPREVPATTGTRFYDATAFSLGDPTPRLIKDFTDLVGAGGKAPDVESFLQPLDNTTAMDFLLPAAAQVGGPDGDGDGDGEGGGDGTGVGDATVGDGSGDGSGPVLPATGAGGIAVAVMALLAGALTWLGLRRRRA